MTITIIEHGILYAFMVWVPDVSYVMCLLSVGYNFSPLLNLTVPANQSFSSFRRCLVSRCLLFSPGPDWAPCLNAAADLVPPFLPHSRNWDLEVGRGFTRQGSAYRCRHCAFSTAKKPNIVSHVQAGLRIRIRIGSGFNRVSGSGFGIWIQDSGSGSRIRNLDPGGQKLPTKVEIFFLSSCFEVLDVLFWELNASSVTWTFFKEA